MSASEWGEGRLTILGADPAHDYLADVYDQQRGTFARLEPEPLSDTLQGQGTLTAIIDTGLLSAHPDIGPRIVESHDFTGEGVEDRVGHGTVVALLFLRGMPQAGLVNLKAVDSSRNSDPENLIRAFHWLETAPQIGLTNVSAGVTRPRCDGDCDVCEAARRASKAGRVIMVAAGNLPGITSCPAKASDAVFTVAAVDARGRLESYSSPATKGGVVGRVPRPKYWWVDASGQPVPSE